MFKMLYKKRCVAETSGTVINIHYNDNGSRRLTVAYFIDGHPYTLKENITVKSVAIKAGELPIGQKKVEYVTAGLNESVVVKYNPKNPKRAYLKDNIGKHV